MSLTKSQQHNFALAEDDNNFDINDKLLPRTVKVLLKANIFKFRRNLLLEKKREYFCTKIMLTRCYLQYRISPYAMRLFKQANIDVVTFPPHSTHIIQPYDVSILRSFKSS